MQSETSQTGVKLSFDPPVPLFESLPTVSQRPEAQALATSETPELNVSEYLNTPSGLGGKRVPCHHVKTLALAASELQHRYNKLGVERQSGDSSLNTTFFNREVPGKKDIHMHVKELDPDMYLAKPGRIARLPGRVQLPRWLRTRKLDHFGSALHHLSVWLVGSFRDRAAESYIDDRASAICGDH